MLVMVFVSDDGSERGTGPLLYVPERPDAILPVNPRGLDWRYFATVAVEDRMFAKEREEVEPVLSSGATYISQRVVR